MINISVNLGNVPSVLASIASDTTVVRMVYVAAETYEAEIHETIKSGQSFTSRSTQLEQSIGWIPTGVNTAIIYANAKHAAPIEHGSKPHIIRAKTRAGLKFFSRGRWVSKPFVNHPGFRPFPYFYRDLAQREQTIRRSILVELANMGITGG